MILIFLRLQSYDIGFYKNLTAPHFEEVVTEAPNDTTTTTAAPAAAPAAVVTVNDTSTQDSDSGLRMVEPDQWKIPEACFLPFFLPFFLLGNPSSVIISLIVFDT